MLISAMLTNCRPKCEEDWKKSSGVTEGISTMKATIGMFRSDSLLFALVLVLLSPVTAFRQPLRKPEFRIKTGQVDDIGRIDYDTKTGDYIFRWKGLDGTEKRAIFIPEWKAKLTVTATVHKTQKGFRYTYVLTNAPKSPQAVVLFELAMTQEPEDVRVSHGWKFWGVSETVVGKLASFSTYKGLPLKPGQSLKIEFFSRFPPGVVKCYAAGDAPIMKVPEEMPGELQDRLPKGIAQSYLWGWTIGPIERVSLPRLFTDWQIAIKEGWVKDEKVARQITKELRQILQMVRQKRSEEVQKRVRTLVQFVRQNRKLFEPEAQALLILTLPYLTGRLRGNSKG
jgi:hypothetical protein